MDIVLAEISKAYGDNQVLSRFSFCFPEHSVTAVMAPSGAGKTTLLRLLLGLEIPDSGRLSGVPRRISALFQEDRLCPELSAVQNIRLVTGRTVPESSIREMLALLQIGDAADLPVSRLSGGMARRAALARALLYDSELLVLDEPFTGLDADSRKLAAEAVRRFRADRTLIFVTHHPEEAELLTAETILRLNKE